MALRGTAVALAGFLAVAAPPKFDRTQPDVFAQGGAFANAWADADGDGDIDLFVGFGTVPNRLYRNDGGVFTDIGVASTTWPSSLRVACATASRRNRSLMCFPSFIGPVSDASPGVSILHDRRRQTVPPGTSSGCAICKASSKRSS